MFRPYFIIIDQLITENPHSESILMPVNVMDTASIINRVPITVMVSILLLWSLYIICQQGLTNCAMDLL